MTALLELNGVSKRFSRRVTLGERVAGMLGSPVETREVRAVENVTLAIAKGETLGLVGESGCGKSTLGRVAAGIYTPSEGEARLDGAAIMSTGTNPTSSPRASRPSSRIPSPPRPAHAYRRYAGRRPARSPARHQARSRANTWRNGSAVSVSTPISPTGIRINSRAASASASPSPARWPCSPIC